MRVALFGSGSPLSLAVCSALTSRHELVATVVPGQRGFRRNALARAARDAGSPTYRFDRELDVRLRAASPDVLCVATFPHRITAAHLATAGWGGVNVHTSLLPRHRGPDPLFWTYFDDDPMAGVTIHTIAEEIDAGDILGQVSIPLQRGRSVADLYEELSILSASVLLEVLRSMELQTLVPRPQDPKAVTVDPRPQPGTFAIRFEDWGAERAWHVLSGLGERRGDLLNVAHGRAVGYALQPHHHPAGTVLRRGDRLIVYCRDGWVEVAKPSARRRLQMILRNFRARVRRLY